MAEVLPLNHSKSVPAQKACDKDSPPSISRSVLSHLRTLHQSLSTEELRKEFISESQNEGDAIAVGNDNASSQGDPFASFDVFLKYISGPDGRAEAPATEEDLSFPIASYFISTSHNTYLTGNQLYSISSTDAYKNVLLRGCRCLEIDVWDGVRQPRNQSEPTGDDVDAASTEKCAELKNEPAAKGDASRKQKGRSAAARHSRTGSLSDRFSSLMRRATFPLTKVSEEPPTTNNKSSVNGPEGGKGTSRVEPRVLHGHTLTKEVPFRDVCYAIRDSAFVHSHLPVIVSLEVHANLEQQEIMVEIMRETWAGLLVDLTADLDTLTCKQPRLADLDRKILVKVKWAPPMAAATECAATEGAATAVDAPLDQVTTSSTPEEQDSPDDTKVPTSSPSKKPKSGGIANALSRLAVYTRAYHFSGFSTPEATIPTHVFSLSESAIRHAWETDEKALRAHNRKYLMRIFPSGMRVTSSNLDPTPCWQVGAQMIALNWQHSGKGMMLNHAMFAGTGGWVLKPKGYRYSGDFPASSALQSANGEYDVYGTFDFAIDVLAGQHIPVSGLGKDFSATNFRPYVKCQLHICTSDLQRLDNDDSTQGKEGKKSKFKKRTKSSTGDDPDFGGEKLVFPQVSNVIPELSFIRLTIHHDENFHDRRAAWACIRLDRLRRGYRLVGLHDATGAPSTGSLLVNIHSKYQKITKCTDT